MNTCNTCLLPSRITISLPQTWAGSTYDPEHLLAVEQAIALL